MEPLESVHHLAPLIRDLAIILGIAGLVTLLFKIIRQPIVLGYLIAGMIIGPYTPPHSLVSDIPNIQTLSELGVIFLMFSLGLEFGLNKLKRVGGSAGIAGTCEVILMLALGFVVGKLIGWSFYDSLFLGACLSISSTTIIIKAIAESNLASKPFAELVFGILIIEDLLALLLLVILSVLAMTQTILIGTVLATAGKLILTVAVWFSVGYFLVPLFFRKFTEDASEETLTIVSVAVCLLFVCIANYFHYSAALGAFLAGSIITESQWLERIKRLITPISNIFAAVFFVSIGMLIDPILIWRNLLVILLLCVVTISGKIAATTIGVLLTGQNFNNALRIGFSMAQIGEFSFIIAGLGLTLQVISHSLYSIIVAVAVITTFTTPYLIRLSGYLTKEI